METENKKARLFWTPKPGYSVHSEGRNRDPRKHKDGKLQRSFGISLESYENLLTKQEGKCAICGAEKNVYKGKEHDLFVDHCHINGNVRGLICHRCNYVLGMVKDDPELLEKMGKYIRFHKGRFLENEVKFE